MGLVRRVVSVGRRGRRSLLRAMAVIIQVWTRRSHSQRYRDKGRDAVGEERREMLMLMLMSRVGWGLVMLEATEGW